MPRIYPEEIKQKVHNLRKCGWSLGEISQKMHISKNTISGWVKNIRLTEKQRERIEKKVIACADRGRPLAAKLLRQKIEKWKEDIRNKVEHFEKLPMKNREIRKLICGLLYLCEGAKYPASRFLYFGNSDPKLIYFFINLLRKTYDIDKNKLRFSIGYRYDQNYEKLKNYWSQLTNIPKSKCLNSKPDWRTKGKPTLKKDYKGICRIIYYDTSLQFELQSIGEKIIKIKWSRRGSNPRTSSMPLRRAPNCATAPYLVHSSSFLVQK